jgi:hypothetical protein
VLRDMMKNIFEILKVGIWRKIKLIGTIYYWVVVLQRSMLEAQKTLPL